MEDLINLCQNQLFSKKNFVSGFGGSKAEVMGLSEYTISLSLYHLLISANKK